jgi:hypothetical protein
MPYYNEKNDYLVFHFYIPDYAMQSTPIVISMRDVKEYGLRGVMLNARDEFLSSLKGYTHGRISPKQMQLWRDGRIQYKAMHKRLSPEVAQFYKRNVQVRHQ